MKKIISVILAIFLSVSLFASDFLRKDEVNFNRYEKEIQYAFTSEYEVNYNILAGIYNNALKLSGKDEEFFKTDKGYSIFVDDPENDSYILIEKEPDWYNWIVYTKKQLKKQTIIKSGDPKISDGKRAGVNTASTRASEAKEDYVWDE